MSKAVKLPKIKHTNCEGDVEVISNPKGTGVIMKCKKCKEHWTDNSGVFVSS